MVKHSWISIHALLAESDLIKSLGKAYRLKFQSTLSSRRATDRDYKPENIKTISIHALLAESDTSGKPEPLNLIHFNPRSPRGERPAKIKVAIMGLQFQSTLSSRRATSLRPAVRLSPLHFNPRSPRGERLNLIGK